MKILKLTVDKFKTPWQGKILKNCISREHAQWDPWVDTCNVQTGLWRKCSLLIQCDKMYINYRLVCTHGHVFPSLTKDRYNMSCRHFFVSVNDFHWHKDWNLLILFMVYTFWAFVVLYLKLIQCTFKAFYRDYFNYTPFSHWVLDIECKSCTSFFKYL